MHTNKDVKLKMVCVNKDVKLSMSGSKICQVMADWYK